MPHDDSIGVGMYRIGPLIPSEVTIVPIFRMFHAAGLIDTHWPLILVPIRP